MWLNPIVTIIITYLINNTLSSGSHIHLFNVSVGQKCDLYNNSYGTCKFMTDCEVVLSALKNKANLPYISCRFSGPSEIVCCPERRAIRIADRECDKIINSTTPILDFSLLGDKTASLGQFPHMVALGYERPSNKYEFLCGGSLVSERFVLTAAHCVDTIEQIKPAISRMGVVEIGGPEFNEQTDIRIAEIIKHPEYLRRYTYHDLALLRLEKPVQFTMLLSPVCLYTSTQDPTVPLTVTGWGKISDTWDFRSDLLLKETVTVVEKKKCSEYYTHMRRSPEGITDTQICAGDAQRLRDTCQVDSGGPLQGVTATDGQYRLIGVTSFSRGCGSPAPTVYTRISSYLDWIENIVWPQ